MRLRPAHLALGASSVLAASTLAAGPAVADEASLVYAVMHEPAALSPYDGVSAQIGQWLYNALYVYDENLSPVPDIAAGPPHVSEDGLVWTVRLREDVYFQPTGERLTAEDVVFTYELANSPACTFDPWLCLAFVTVTPEGAEEPVKVLQGVEAIDDFTVRFTLADAYAPFGTELLPYMYIESRDAIEDAFAAFEEETADVDAADVDAVIAAGIESETYRAEAEDLITTAGRQLPDEAMHQTEDGTLDEMSYAAALESSLAGLSAVLNAQELDRIAAAYKYLHGVRQPVGTGPFFVTDWRPGQNITAVRNERYHHGLPALESLYILFIEDDAAGGAALAAGTIDWRPTLGPDGYAQVKDVAEVKLARYLDFGYTALQFNLREGRLFHERAVRQALAHCFDKPATVEAATYGQGVPVYSDIPPASWAYNPDVPRYEYDVEKGRALLEEAGWTDEDGDGVREKAGRPLASHILMRAGRPERTRFMRLLAEQARDCGFDLTLREAPFTLMLRGLEWPLIMPGQDEQWDAYFGGWGTSHDPNPFALWHSSNCVTEEKPTHYNYVCFQNERVDELIEAGLREIDQARRAEIYQEYSMIMAKELPYLWAWSDQTREGLRRDVNGAEEWTAELMSTPSWHWRLEEVNKGSPAGPE